MRSTPRSHALVHAVLWLLTVGVAGACHQDSAARVPPASPLVTALGRMGLPRLITPRLSIPVDYRPCKPPAPRVGAIPGATCRPGAGDGAPPSGVLDVAARSSAILRDTLDPGALQAAALVDLLWADSAGISLGRSISYFRNASRLGDESPGILGDLAAAYLVRAARVQNPRDLLEAVDAAARALAAEPRSAPARFNMALALDQLGFDEQALHAWQAYLDVDSLSPWAADVKARLSTAGVTHTVHRPVGTSPSDSAVAAYVAASPQQARLWGWDTVLGAWGAAQLRGDTARARALLHRAGSIGSALEQRGGDATLADAVRAIAHRQRDGAALRSLALAHRAYAAGRAAYVASDYATARHRFEQVLATAAPSPPLRQWATLFLGGTFVYLNQRTRAEQLLRRVVTRADTTRAPALAARARWSLGVTLLRGGQHDAVGIVQAANPLFARSGERENLGAVQFVEGEADLHVGKTAAGYAELYQALMTLRPYRGSVWLHNVLWTLARAAAADGLVHAAIIVQDEDVAVAGRTGRPVDPIEARLSRARVLAAMGDSVDAARDIAAARAGVGHLPPGSSRNWFETDLRLSEAAALRHDPARAAAALDSVIAFFSRAGNPVRLLPAVLAHARMLLAMDNVAGATADLDSAVALLDQRRVEIAAEPLRASLLDAMHAIFDQLAILRLAAGHPDQALAVVERGRVSMAPVASAHRSWNRDTAIAPPGEVVVDYALVGDTLLVWTIEGPTAHLVRRTVDRSRLERTIARTRAALELRVHTSALRPDLASLYDWLVRPIEMRLGPPGTPLVVVTDGDIAGVPFGALYDARHRRYVVENHTIRFVPSLRDAPHEPSPPARSSALFVADPAFDRAAFPEFGPLPGAAAEVQALVTIYENPVVLAGAAADRVNVARALQRATVFHYAGHAVFDDERPDASFLALAATSDDTGRLTATDVAQLDLRHVQLVVLSACQTMHTRSGRSGGFAGLAGAFLAAGARGVVGSLWRVDDALTRALMVDFHQAYRRSGNGATALRTAQLGFLHSPDPLRRSPAAWAGYRYAGH